jgi:excisionase family DNA binding protein
VNVRRRPLRATLAPATARVLVLYLETDKSGFMAWMSAVKRRLPIEDQLQLEEDLADLGLVANWQRDFVASDVGQREPAATDLPRRSEREEITTREAADMLQVSDRHVRRLVDDGALQARRVNARQLMVSRSSVLAYRQAVA